MAFTDGFVKANGVKLHYLDWGGDGPVVLFLHPTGFHAHIWEPLAEHLSRWFRCLAIDTRGHGDSDKPGVYGWPDYANDLEGALDVLGVSGVVGVGHSAGATSITIVAERRPELFSRAVLIDPILFFGPDTLPHQPDSRMQNAARRRRMGWPSREAAIENYGSKPPFNGWRPDLLELYVRNGVYDRPDGTVVLKCSGEDEAKMYAWGPRPLHSDEYLPRVQCPVLLISGEHSLAFPPEKARQAAAMIPDCPLLTIPDTTHFVPFERPDAVQAAICDFLGVE